MKKIMTILLAAALSGAMLVGMTACNNGGNNDGNGNAGGNNSVVNPFAQLTSTDSTVSSAPSNVQSSVPVAESSVLVVDPSVTPPTQSSDEILTPPTPASSNPWDESDWDESDWDESDWDESDWDESDWDESEPSFQYSSITPTGTVNPAYAGHYTMKIDFDKIDWSQYGITEISGVDIQQYIEQYKSMFEAIQMDMTLKADGSVSASATAYGQTSSSDNGSWSADGTTVYITIDGSTANFVYNNGVLTGGDTPYMYFVKD